jgi:branched-chain amino acid transport system permease protein
MIDSIIGGIGSISVAIVVGFFLGIVVNLGVWNIQAEWKDAISFAALIVILLYRPGGVYSVKAEPERV